MLTLQNAFVGESVAQTMTMIVKGSYPPLKPAVGGQQCDEELAALLDMLLSVDKAGRPTAAAALGAPLLGPSLAEYKLQTQRGQQLLGNSTALSLPSARVAPDWDGDLDAMERLLASVVLDDEGFAETPGLLDEGFEAELDRAAGELEHHGRPARRVCESVDDVLRGRLSAAEATAAVAHVRARRAGAAGAHAASPERIDDRHGSAVPATDTASEFVFQALAVRRTGSTGQGRLGRRARARGAAERARQAHDAARGARARVLAAARGVQR